MRDRGELDDDRFVPAPKKAPANDEALKLSNGDIRRMFRRALDKYNPPDKETGRMKPMAEVTIVKVEEDCEIIDVAGPNVANPGIVRDVTLMVGDKQVQIKQAVRSDTKAKVVDLAAQKAIDNQVRELYTNKAARRDPNNDDPVYNLFWETEETAARMAAFGEMPKYDLRASSFDRELKHIACRLARAFRLFHCEVPG